MLKFEVSRKLQPIVEQSRVTYATDCLEKFDCETTEAFDVITRRHSVSLVQMGRKGEDEAGPGKLRTAELASVLTLGGPTSGFRIGIVILNIFI